MRGDLVALGMRLGWVAAEEKEEPALDRVRSALREGGEGLLLIFDNAIDGASVRPYLPQSGAARALITSNSPAWRGVATLVEIPLWPRQVGADYLIARTGCDKERADAEALSEALGGLTLAHEQAGAYCERLGISLAEYRKRFAAAPAPLLDASKDASAEYHGGLTVAKAFALAIDEAAKVHPAAEPLRRCSRPSRYRCSCFRKRAKHSASRSRRRSRARDWTRQWGRCSPSRWSTGKRFLTSATHQSRPTRSVCIGRCASLRRSGHTARPQRLRGGF
jgi:hypothetical protein